MRGPGETQLEEDRRLVDLRIRDLKDRLAEVQARKEREVAQPPRGAHRLAGRLHQRRQEHADERPDRRRRPGRGQAVFDARHAHPAMAASRTGAGCCSATRSASSAICRTIWSPRSRRRWKRARQARLLLHVVDAGNPHAEEQIKAVNSVLKELGCDDKPTLLVLNKIDRVRGSVVPARAAEASSAVGGRQRGHRPGARRPARRGHRDAQRRLRRRRDRDRRGQRQGACLPGGPRRDLSAGVCRRTGDGVDCSLPRHLLHHIQGPDVEVRFVDNGEVEKRSTS